MTTDPDVPEYKHSSSLVCGKPVTKQTTTMLQDIHLFLGGGEIESLNTAKEQGWVPHHLSWAFHIAGFPPLSGFSSCCISRPEYNLTVSYTATCDIGISGFEILFFRKLRQSLFSIYICFKTKSHSTSGTSTRFYQH